jgi:hypothetical protein
VEFREFWILLVYIQKYFGYMGVFATLDADNSGKMTHAEWIAGVPVFVEEMGLVVDDVEATFTALDVGGDNTVSFDEFFEYAVGPALSQAQAQPQAVGETPANQAQEVDEGVEVEKDESEEEL